MNVVIKVKEETKNKMIDYYKDKKRDKIIPYVIFQAQEEDTVITMYESGKVMFQGTSADIDANMWKAMDGQAATEEIEKKEKEYSSGKYHNCSSIGSDEVGTGDYFGPIIVTSCYVNKNDVEYLDNLGIRDSKKINDEKILKVAPEIAKRIRYKSIILNNTEYNEKYGNNNNINKIKAILHNKVLFDMTNEIKKLNLEYDYIIIDEFAREARYYDYIKECPNIQKEITFMTKAEDQNLAVACASVISRYIFIKEFDKLSDSIHIPLPKGAGPAIDEIGKEIVEKYGKDKLKDIAKMNFKNTERILGTLIF